MIKGPGQPPLGGRSSSIYAGQMHRIPTTKISYRAPYTPRDAPVIVLETRQGARHEGTVTADERASILRRYTALRQSGGRSKSDSVVKITKEHGVAR